MEQFPLSPSRVGTKSGSLKQTAGIESGVRRNLKHVPQPKENGIFKTDKLFLMPMLQCGSWHSETVVGVGTSG